ncbi:MAG TPA: glycosyltransferase family 87 protein [Candidatus Dormibacteraeota bacterium]|nr:glycosyltransferase family 87 protein [Candidatus Dormibacteraeota bacterium]
MRRNLAVAAAAAAAGVSAAYSLWLWFSSYMSDNFHNDFTFYYAAARLGLAHGWSHLYDLRLQQEQLDAIGSHITIAQLARYVSPPPLAWLVTPLTVLPYQVAYWIWSALLVGALVLAWRLAAPGAGRARVIFLVAAVGWLPIIYGLQLGQPALLVAAGVAACCALLQRGRDIEAGAVLAVLVLKPQLALLVPVVLLVSGRWRAFASAVVVLAVITAASLVALGPSGTTDYLDRLNFAATVPENQAQTLAAWIHNLAITRAAQGLIAVWTLGVACRLHRHGPAVVLAVALLGGLAASPYVHFDDLAMLGLACLLFLSATRDRWVMVYAFALFVAAEGFPVWQAGPVLAGELVALLLLSVPLPAGAPTFEPARPRPG